MPAYTHFRYIAWEVPTVIFKTDPTIDGVSGWKSGEREHPAVERLPVPDSVTDPDARVRLRRLAGIVDTAATLLDYTVAEDDTLNIFMVPEFYFRPPTEDKSNTYSLSVFNKIVDALSTMFEHDNFKNWLFVCGTVMWDSKEDIKATIPLYFNTAVCVRGGSAIERKYRMNVIEKQWPSSIDGIPKGVVEDFTKTLAPGKIMPSFNNSWWIRKQRVFEQAGIQFGLEVCLDHRYAPRCRVLKRVLRDWGEYNNLEAPPKIGLHLLTAGGMTIDERSVSAKIGGYILRNDGLAYQVNRSELRKVESYSWDRALWETRYKRAPTGADLHASATLGDPVLSVDYKIPQGDGQVTVPQGYKKFDQRLVFYTAQKLPD